jgi:hypothetical protein
VETKLFKANLLDISFKGAGVHAKQMLAAGTPVRFIITSKSFEDHIGGDGRIVYARPMKRNEVAFFRMGIEFINVDSELVRDILLALQEELSKNLGKTN